MNFWKIIKSSFRYRWSIVFCVLTALGVGVLWGTNLSAVYPFMEITFKGQTMQDWAAKAIAESEERLAELQNQTKTPEIEYKIQIEESALYGYRTAGAFVEKFVPHDAFLTIAALLAALLALTVLKTIFLILNSVLVAHIANRTIFDIRNALYDKCLLLDLAHYNQDGSAQLMSRMTNDVAGINTGLSNIYGKMVREPLKMFVCLGLAIWINWQLFVITVLILPPIAWAIQKLAKKIKRASKVIMHETAKLYQKLQETFHGIKIVKCFTLEAHERAGFQAQGEVIYRGSLKVAFFDVLAKGLIESSGILIVSVALLAGAGIVLCGEGTSLFGIPMATRPLTIEWLVMFYVALLGAADPARKLSDIFTSLQNAAAASDRVYELLEMNVEIQTPIQPVEITTSEPDLTFEHVCFDYMPDRPVLRDIDWTIPFGSTVAIVGPNGCGKSTLLSLIPRLADPNAGRITLGGIPYQDLSLDDLHARIGLVSQDAILFNDTVYNNIRFGRLSATEAEILDASRRAFAHPFISETLPQGYDTPLGPYGNLLSGGQRQRLALARVILRDPQILLLDEATSQIDVESERSIQEALSEFHRGRTVVIVTHRPALLALADQIAVMDSGRITDLGTHDELMARNEFYQKLF